MPLELLSQYDSKVPEQMPFGSPLHATYNDLCLCCLWLQYQTYHELIASDKEIVKSILRLTGSVEGVKVQVSVHILALIIDMNTL
jgi:hypothetical protein